MFVGRVEELSRLKEQLNREDKTAVLIYGKRRVGKSTLIAEASKSFDGKVISYMCVQSTLEGNLTLMSRSISIALGIPEIRFQTLKDIFDYLGSQNDSFLFVIDEYQYLKQAGKKNEIDSYMQIIIDMLPSNVKLIMCGSYITIMKELLEEDNPLFGRFTEIMHIEEFDYYDAALLYPESELRRKFENYAIFGGSPYVLSTIDSKKSIKENIIKLLLPETSVLRTYIENVILKEIQKAYDIRIFQLIGNGSKKYSDLISGLSGSNNGLLDKQLKNLINMEAVEKIAPINKLDDKKKQFYVISDNLMRFFFTYIFGNDMVIRMLGEEVFYETYIEKSIDEYIQRRFEGIVVQYFKRKVRSRSIKGVLNIGSYWYDDPKEKKNGQFDVVLKKEDEYLIYECKFFNRRMTLQECEDEEKQVSNIGNLGAIELGFVNLGGFEFESNRYSLIDGDMLFANEI